MISARIETWLEATWHLKVPSHWLQACVEWIHQENQGITLTQAQINKQVFEQWLLTDLRDLEYPILPDGISEMKKCDLNGFYCLQIDSLIDVSQAAYSQLQKIRGKDTTNEQVTSTQISQRSWEAKPTRMLMLQLTDGVQELQGMEYKPIPALHSGLSPGTKILLLGNIACRLGVLLLKPENIRMLGGEVESLMEENSQDRLLARLIGESYDTAVTRVSNNQNTTERTNGMPQLLEPSDDELLAGFDEDDLLLESRMDSESGYCSRIGTMSCISNCTQPLSSRWQSMNSQIPEMSREFQSENRELLLDCNDEDFDEFPLDEFDDLFVQGELNAETEPDRAMSQSPTSLKSLVEEPQRNNIKHVAEAADDRPGPCQEQNVKAADNTSGSQLQSQAKHLKSGIHTENAGPGSMLSDRNSMKKTGIPSVEGTNNTSVLAMELRKKQRSSLTLNESFDRRPKNDSVLGNLCTSSGVISGSFGSGDNFHNDGAEISNMNGRTFNNPFVSLNSPPFTYLNILLDKKPDIITVVQIKGFIVTLLDKLTSNGGQWNIKARISDGTAYMDVELGDNILRSLIGFSVAEMRNSIKCSNQQQKVTAGLQKCQQELVDLCCLMTIEFNPTLTTRVLAFHEVTLEDLQNLEYRVHSRGKKTN
ncbi:recQ-mediated genome instability protein 1 [Chiloscyllium plagiosum]|uniref:recQ-mediated genome instability protein 1 n=1 Tax=Chiloscyllium plagiosum TaxID=36176 RepID=UPI001CB7FB81|nr:recQ-mediated genome instability protein 1 [Chiloscyllium plagiosum]XP_043541760.1 recQ-mediated genome instability protein 1 [Chiloscyllium plagiosum]XP_043541761.1 recQ-mediated genome instability protein 1 [Chiloscyllium plagiosum]XP_043541762.1 recQ-mediated genome instability protein 1 [Chiloscyllium plagiosum]XP_043541763.1 recQ-mediated genome instability protein 1 [Chiloscyllium plagiosum]